MPNCSEEEATAAAGGVRTVAADLGGFDERIGHEPGERRPVVLASVVVDVVAAVREARPGTEVAVAVVVPGLTGPAGSDLRTALREVVESGPEHDDDPWVRIDATVEDARVVVTVAADGPGTPDIEGTIVTGERPPTRLEHASGVGLRPTSWSVESCGGEFAIDDRTGRPGSLVRMRVDRA